MNDKLFADQTGLAKFFYRIYRADKQFFKTFKIKAFLALNDKLRHQQMTKITQKIVCFLCLLPRKNTLQKII